MSMGFLDRRLNRLPRPWGTLASWLVTIAVAVLVVLVFQAEVAKPFRIPSSSMEPTLHCARPSGGCQAEFSDRVLACEICLRVSSPKRGQIVVFNAPPLAKQRCGEGGDYVKRLIGMPGDLVSEDDRGLISINGRMLDEPYITAAARASDVDFRGQSWRVPAARVLHDGRQPRRFVRLAAMGRRAAIRPDRRGVRDLLAPEPGVAQLDPGRARTSSPRAGRAVCPLGCTGSCRRGRNAAIDSPNGEQHRDPAAWVAWRGLCSHGHWCTAF